MGDPTSGSNSLYDPISTRRAVELIRQALHATEIITPKRSRDLLRWRYCRRRGPKLRAKTLSDIVELEPNCPSFDVRVDGISIAQPVDIDQTLRAALERKRQLPQQLVTFHDLRFERGWVVDTYGQVMRWDGLK